MKLKEEKKQAKNKFLEEQKRRHEENERKKKQKHLFRQTNFVNSKGEKVKQPCDEDLPYEKIEVVFNSKNMWLNCQNLHPNYIYYNLHREKQWAPLIFNSEFDKSDPSGKKKEKEDKLKSGSGSETDRKYTIDLYLYR